MKSYQYVTLRCVPRVEREEFVNVGVVLHCSDHDFLAVRSSVDEDRIRALDASIDPDEVRSALAALDQVCRGEGTHGFGVGVRATAYGVRESKDDLGTRFGLLKAPRSTVIQVPLTASNRGSAARPSATAPVQA